MAYRKAKTRKRRSYRRSSTTRRRRRIGGIGRKSGNTTRLLGLVVGALAPAIVGNIKVKGEPIDGKIVGAASVVLGYLLPGFVKGELFAGIGDGMIASGGVKLLQEFNVLGAIPVIAGWQNMPTISGTGSAQERLQQAAQSSNFRPSASQIMAGIHRGRRDD